MGRQGCDTHRHDRTLGSRERPDSPKKLVGARPVHHPEDGMATWGQPEGALSAILRLLVALDETPPDEAVDQSAGRRWRAPDRLGELTNGQRASVGKDIERGKLGEPEAQLPELAGKTDDQLSPECTAHGHALADLPHVW